MQAVVSFLVNSRKLKKEADAVLQKFGILDIPSDPSRDEPEEGFIMDYSFSVTYNPDFMERLFISLKKISVYIQPDFHFEPIFSDEEFNSSPLFKLQSFGYEQSRYLENKGKYKQRLFCPTCKKKVDEQIEPLAINTAIVKKYDLVYVDKKIVISDKIVSLLEKWNLTGYRIEQVTHVGAEKFKTDAYQVVPTNILPPQDVPGIFRNAV